MKRRLARVDFKFNLDVTFEKCNTTQGGFLPCVLKPIL